jgi:hypothetical protein
MERDIARAITLSATGVSVDRFARNDWTGQAWRTDRRPDEGKAQAHPRAPHDLLCTRSIPVEVLPASLAVGSRIG